MATKGESGFFEDWPRWAKPTMALAAMILLGGAWIGVPFLLTWRLLKQSTDFGVVVDYQPIATVLIAMTTATITGIFLFMTLRIDRGTRLKAENVARDAVKDEVKAARERLDKVEKQLGKIEMDASTILARKFDEGTAPRNISKEVQARLTADVLRGHVKDVLMIDANVQMVGQYVKERARDLNPETIERLLPLLEGAFKALRELDPRGSQIQHKDLPRAFFKGLKDLFSGFHRSSKGK